ncbi:hypothetical protein CsSME_00044689 [Camellia sinensis var. sinensis]
MKMKNQRYAKICFPKTSIAVAGIPSISESVQTLFEETEVTGFENLVGGSLGLIDLVGDSFDGSETVHDCRIQLSF